MKIPRRTIILVLFFSVLLFAQDLSAQSRKVMKAERKAEKVKEQQKKDFEKARKKELKHRWEIQSPKTKERMKETRKDADQFNNRMRKNHEPFWKKIFRRKRPK